MGLFCIISSLTYEISSKKFDLTNCLQLDENLSRMNSCNIELFTICSMIPILLGYNLETKVLLANNL